MSILRLIRRIAGKKWRKMAKNAPKKGHSARNGNSPAPYTKYQKTPYKYSWQRPSANVYALEQKEEFQRQHKTKKRRAA